MRGKLLVAALMPVLAIAASAQQRLPPNSSSTPSLSTDQPKPSAPSGAPAVASQPIRVTIHGTTINLPLMNGYCPFDEAQAYDRDFIGGFRETLNKTLQIVRFTQECAGLERGRSGVLPALNSFAYMTTVDANGGWKKGSRRDAATFTCNNMRNATGGERLKGKSPASRALEAQAIIDKSTTSERFVLLQDPTACHSFSHSLEPGGLFPKFMQIQVFTRIKGHLIITNVVHTTREAGDTLPPVSELLERALSVAAELERLNGEK